MAATVPGSPPFNVRIRGVEVPLTALLGGLGTFGAFVVAMALDPVILVTGGGWMLFGTLVYVLYRRRQGLPLTETVKVASLEPLGVAEVEYRSVLVVFRSGEFSEEVIATAKALAARRRRAIHVLSLVEVPTDRPLDADLGSIDDVAQSVIERAKLVCGRRVSGEVVHARPGQAGSIIIEEANAIDAAVVVMGLRYRDGQPVFSKALRTLLAERPCRVIVVAKPDAAGPVEGGAAAGRRRLAGLAES